MEALQMFGLFLVPVVIGGALGVWLNGLEKRHKPGISQQAHVNMTGKCLCGRKLG